MGTAFLKRRALMDFVRIHAHFRVLATQIRNVKSLIISQCVLKVSCFIVNYFSFFAKYYNIFFSVPMSETVGLQEECSLQWM